MHQQQIVLMLADTAKYCQISAENFDGSVWLDSNISNTDFIHVKLSYLLLLLRLL